MANPTTNYGFVLPTPTDLVTDLPADFDVALQGVDTRLKALQPGTTLGDLAYSSATANTNTRLGVGTTGQVLTVAGGVPTWATPASVATFVGANATKQANQSLANVTMTAISFDGTDILDSNGFHDPSSNNTRMTIPTGYGGNYLIQAQIQFAPGTAAREVQIYKNGATILQMVQSIAPGSTNMIINGTFALVATDYVEIRAYQSTGGALDVWGTASGYTNPTSFQITYLGA